MSRARSYGVTVVVVVAASLLAYSAYRRKASGTDVRAAIADAIHHHNDSLTVTDPTTGTPVTLTFDHVHADVEQTPGGRYFACVDFRTPAGLTYDIDYYMGHHGANLQIQDVVVHKVGGQQVIACTTRARLDAKQ